MNTSPSWAQALLARAHKREVARVPFVVNDVVVGSVAQTHLPALAALAQSLRSIAEAALQIHGTQVSLGSTRSPLSPASLSRALQALNLQLREQGLIQGWRNESFALPNPQTLDAMAQLERASTRFWGTLTFGVHANGYVRAPQGGTISHLWIAKRAADKATDPGLFDNLVGGGLPAGQSPLACLLREAQEEAGLTPPQTQTALRLAHGCLDGPSFAQDRPLHSSPKGQPVSTQETCRDTPHGLQWERLLCFDLELATDWQPRNTDGEVANFQLMHLAQAAAASSSMTVDAALVTLDFLRRHAPATLL